QYLHAAIGRVLLGVLQYLDRLIGRAEDLPVLRIVAALQVTRLRDDRRHLDELVAVEIEVREDRVAAATGLRVVVREEDAALARHAGYVRRRHEPLRAERLGVANEQL